MKKLIAFLFLTASAFGQGGIHNGIALNSSGRPASGATVRICTPTATATPCSPAATIYSDSTLSTEKGTGGVFNADANGNYWFYAPLGNYKEQVTVGNSTYTSIVSVLPNMRQGTTLSAFGDSITAGTAATTAAQRYVNVFATQKGLSLTNNAVGGYALADMMDSIFASSTLTSSVSLLMTGVNDMLDAGTGAGSSPDRQTIYQNQLYAAVAWLTIPTTNKVKGIAPANTTGSWTTSTKYSSGLVLQTTGAANTATYNVQGDTVYVSYLAECLVDATPAIINTCTPNTSTFTITVDSVNYGTYSTGITNRLSRNERLYGPQVVRFPNLIQGVHSVVITSASGTDASDPVMVAFVAGNSGALTNSGPWLYLLDCLRLVTPTGYSGSSGSDTAVYQFNEKIKQVGQELAQDGLGVQFVDITKAYDPATCNCVANDGIHPTDLGHSLISTYLANYSSPLVSPADRGALQAHGKVYSLAVGSAPATTGQIKLSTNSSINWLGTDGGSANFIKLDPINRFVIHPNFSGLPDASGTSTQANLRVQGNGNAIIDFGTVQSGSLIGWIQVTNTSNNATNYPLLLNVNGGNVGIGSTTANYTLDVSGIARSSGKGQFEGGVQPAATGDSITWFKKATHATLDLASVADKACSAEQTETISGVALGDSCSVSSATALEAGGFARCAATATDTVKWQLCNLSGGAIDRASDTYTIRVTR